MSKPSSTYRPDIDGLRAVAILGVLVFHLNERLLPGGFVGVDVFFVISGFLISSIIDRDLAAGKFLIARFYERRIRRIFPALLALISVVLAVSVFLLLPQDLLALGNSVRYAVLGFSNVHFLRETEGYFNETVSEIPLLHTWSLGVEEQFYLVFPFLLATLYRFVKTPGGRMVPLAVMFVASLAASIWVVGIHPMKAFYLLPFRAWELLLGSLLALARLPSPGTRLNQGLGVAGLAMIAASMALFDGKTVFPGASALLPCGGAGLLIFAGRRPESWTGRLLALKPVVFIGLVSYSLYLWHWPLIALAKYSRPWDGTTAMIVFAASLLFGVLSWRYIERPFRNQEFVARRRVFSLWAVSSVILLGGCLWIARSEGFPGRFPPEVRHFLAFKEKPPHWKISVGNESDPGKGPVFGAPGVSPKFALWGDSHGAAMLPAIEAMAIESGESFKKFGLGALPPVAGAVMASDRDSRDRFEYSQEVLDLLVADSAILTVILHARWSLYCRGRNELGQSDPKPFYGQPNQNADEMDRFYASRIKETVDRLLAAGKKVVLVYPVPEAGLNVPDLLAKQAAAGSPITSTVACSDFFERQGFVIKVLDSLGKSGRIIRVKPHEKLLSMGQLTVQVGGKSLYMDDDHLSAVGALYIKSMFAGVFSYAAAR